MRYLWIVLGWCCVGLGIAGAILPLLPTTPFLLLAAFAFSRGSQTLHQWLLDHPHLGPPIHHWQTQRAIARPVKITALVTMAVLFAISLALQLVWWALLAQGLVLCTVGIILWRMKEPE